MPSQFLCELTMEISITEEMLAGARALPFADRYHFEDNLIDLLNKNLKFKQSWLLNVQAARQRYDRQNNQEVAQQTVSRARSKLLKWIATGRAF